jgi:large subunit ribosomal protein L32e
MTTEVKRLIQVRTDKGARFKRDGYGKKRQLSDSWRKPRGQHNKQREQKKAKGALPKPGFGSPVAVRGMHPSGFFEVLVTSLKDLEGLDPKTQAVRLGATVGTRKRTIIQEQAVSAGLKVLNARVVVEKTKAKPVKKDMGKEKAEKKAPAKKTAVRSKPEKTEEKAEKKAPAKKTAVKSKKTEEKAEKKTPAKKTASKPKAEKPEVKADKKAPAKKAASKPKAEKTAEVKPKAAAKPKAKTTKSGVKKNE